MRKCLLLSAALLVPGVAHATTVVTIPFSGAFGADAYGQYHAGDSFSGTLSYHRGNEDLVDGGSGAFLQDRGAVITFKTAIESLDAGNPYVTYFINSKTFEFSSPRTVPLFDSTFNGVASDEGFLPTAQQLMGHSGSFSYWSRTGDDEFSGGTGTLTFDGTMAAPVPEPATWALMFAGIALAGGAARYRRRKIKMAYA